MYSHLPEKGTTKRIFFFASSANRSFNRVSAKGYCHVVVFKWGGKTLMQTCLGVLMSSLNSRLFFSK